jgi:hypothetical protein
MPWELSHDGYFGISSGYSHGLDYVTGVILPGGEGVVTDLTHWQKPIQPRVLSPQAGEPFDAQLVVEVEAECDEYHLEARTGEGWWTEIMPWQAEPVFVLNTSSWEQRRDWQVRVTGRVGTAESTPGYSQRFVIDHRVERRTFFRDFTAEEPGEVQGMTKLWDTSVEGWHIGGPGWWEPNAIPQPLLVQPRPYENVWNPDTRRVGLLAPAEWPAVADGIITTEIRQYSYYGAAGVALQASGLEANESARGYFVGAAIGPVRGVFRRAEGYTGRGTLRTNSNTLQTRMGVPTIFQVMRLAGRIYWRWWVRDQMPPHDDWWLGSVEDTTIEAAGVWGFVAYSGFYENRARRLWQYASLTNFEADPPEPPPLRFFDPCGRPVYGSFDPCGRPVFGDFGSCGAPVGGSFQACTS